MQYLIVFVRPRKGGRKKGSATKEMKKWHFDALFSLERHSVKAVRALYYSDLKRNHDEHYDYKFMVQTGAMVGMEIPQ